MSTYDILVIILSVVLGIFLILAIVALVLIIKLIYKLKKITDSAGHIVKNLESFSESMIKTSGPINAVRTAISLFKGKSRKERG